MATPIIEHLMGNRNAYVAWAPDFRMIFGRPLKPWWSNFTGFDFVAFDAWVAPADDESTEDSVRRRWGEQAANLIRRLIGGEPPANPCPCSFPHLPHDHCDGTPAQPDGTRP